MPLPETGLNWIFPQDKWGPLSAPNPALGHFPPHLQNITPDPKGHCRNPAFQFAGDVFYTLWTSPGNTLISEKPNVSQDAYNVAHPGVQNARGPCNAPPFLTFSPSQWYLLICPHRPPLQVLLQLLFKDASFSLWRHWNLLFETLLYRILTFQCFYVLWLYSDHFITLLLSDTA